MNSKTDFSDFVAGYIEAVYFTYGGPDDPTGFDDAELSFNAHAEIEFVCTNFIARAGYALVYAAGLSDYSFVQAGRDFLFTRNRHGVGFCDREQLPTLLSEILSDCAHTFIDYDYTVGDDGLIY